jgi:predicted nucleic acid-binding protein
MADRADRRYAGPHQAAGQPMPVEDSYIAAIAHRHNLTVVTGNAKDFQRPGIKIFNPFEELDA